MLKISALLPTFNRSAMLKTAIEGVLGQTHPVSELIVIDDGSTDATAEVARGYGERVRYVKKENGGKAAALNVGLGAASGDYIWVMDDDDMALPDACEVFARALENDPVDVVCCTHHNSVFADGGIEIKGTTRMPRVEASEAFIRLAEECFVDHPALLARRSCYEALGGFDPELIRCQDYDMLLKLALNFRMKFIDEPIFHSRLHSGVRGSSRLQFAITERTSMATTFNKQIFTRFYETVPLEAYVPAAARTHLDPREIHRRALLQRACIMSRQGLPELMTRDLATIFFDPSMAATQLSAAEIDICRRTTNSPLAATLLCRGHLPRAAGGRNPLRRAVMTNYARGAYYCLRAAIDRRDFGTAYKTLRLLGATLT